MRPSLFTRRVASIRADARNSETVVNRRLESSPNFDRGKPGFSSKFQFVVSPERNAADSQAAHPLVGELSVNRFSRSETAQKLASSCRNEEDQLEENGNAGRHSACLVAVRRNRSASAQIILLAGLVNYRRQMVNRMIKMKQTVRL